MVEDKIPGIHEPPKLRNNCSKLYVFLFFLFHLMQGDSLRIFRSKFVFHVISWSELRFTLKMLGIFYG